jgi:hypothetical protein
MQKLYVEAMADDVEHLQQRWVEEISVKPHVFL